MTWARIDDQFPNHPKIVAVGPLAGWLHVCAICYCNSQLTDGYIPSGMLRRLADVPDADALADALVTIGLWERTDAGYLIHDFLEYNPPAERVKEKRAMAAARQARWAAGKQKQTANASADASTNAVTNASPSPTPITTTNVVAPPKKISPKQQNVAKVAMAFGELGIKFHPPTGRDVPHLHGLIEAGYTPMQIAECWRDYKTYQYRAGDGFADGQLSFAFLAGYNRMGNWMDWVERGRPVEVTRTNGKAVAGKKVRDAD